MCGIVGIYRYKTGTNVRTEEIKKMCSVIQYRGPDGDGCFVDGPVGLGHQRLSIIDTSDRSAQPMQSQDGQIVLSYNGEIYNYLELKKGLSSDGVSFRTSSDTEVLLESLRRKGKAILPELNGMFGFAVWDRAAKSLLVARDHLGIKPLYYKETSEGVIFSSEIKSILQIDPSVDVNHGLLDAYMSLGYCPGPETLFSGVKKLPPGHYLEIVDGQLTVEPFWDITYSKDKDLGEEYYLDKLDSLFFDAVKLQLRSDVPLGVFLSGGLDSSAVVAMMKHQGVQDIQTFSVAWDFGKDYNETQYARQIANKFETTHHEYFMSSKDFVDFLPDYIWHMDEPVTEAAAISLYYIAKKAKENVTVVLSGEGADEVFGGYPIYKYFQLLNYYKKVPGFIRSVLNPLLMSLGDKWGKYVDLSNKPLEQGYMGVSLYDANQKQSLYSTEMLAHANSHSAEDRLAPFYQPTRGLDLQSRMQYLDLKSWLVDDLLIKADRMSMAASLELRVPFLDYRIMEFSGTLPSKYRLKNGECKYLLKKAMEKYLPKEVIYRKKQGFPTPLSILFKKDLFDMVSDTLGSNAFRQRGYFNQERINQLLEEHHKGKKDHHRILWQLVVLELWHQRFVRADLSALSK